MNNNGYFFQEVLVKNPVLVATVGLCPVVAICTSLKAAVILSIITILTLLLAQVVTSLFLRKLPQWARLGIYTIIGMIVVVPSMLIVQKSSPEAMLALGIYFPLLAVNPLVVRNCEREAVDASLASSILTSICAGLGYSIVLLIVGVIREFFGAGTLWDKPVSPFETADALMMPVGGFIIIAFMAAALRAYLRKVDPELADQLIASDRTNIHSAAKAKLAFNGAKYIDGTTAAPRKKKKSRKELRRERQQIEPKSKIQVMTLEEAEEQRAASLPPVDSTLQVELAPTDNQESAEQYVEQSVSESTVSEPVPKASETAEEIISKLQSEILSERESVSQNTSRFDFVTLDLGQKVKESSDSDSVRFAKAVEESRKENPQNLKIKRGQVRTVKESANDETPVEEGEDK